MCDCVRTAVVWTPLVCRTLRALCGAPPQYFSSNRLSLLDRGFIFGIAHIRGGGEMGRSVLRTLGATLTAGCRAAGLPPGREVQDVTWHAPTLSRTLTRVRCRWWYEDGKFEKKLNTFNDFIAAAGERACRATSSREHAHV